LGSSEGRQNKGVSFAEPEPTKMTHFYFLNIKQDTTLGTTVHHKII
jgi:hypothetical protein